MDTHEKVGSVFLLVERQRENYQPGQQPGQKKKLGTHHSGRFSKKVVYFYVQRKKRRC